MRWAVLAATFLCAPLAEAQDDDHVGLRVREWFTRMDGTIRSGDAISGGTRADVDRDLGWGDRTLAHEVQAFINLPDVGRFCAGGWWDSVRGDKVLTQDVTFLIFTFPSTTEVKTSFDLSVFYLSYEYAFPRVQISEGLNLGLGLQTGARVVDGRGTIEESNGSSASNHGLVGLPVLGGRVSLDFFSWARAEVEVLGMAFSYSGNRAAYLEVNGEIVAEPLPWLFAGVGYKLANIRLHESGSKPFDVDVGLRGLYLTAGLRF